MILQGLLIGVRVGGAYALGNWGGGMIAARLNVAQSDAARIGIKIGVGVAAFAITALIL